MKVLAAVLLVMVSSTMVESMWNMLNSGSYSQSSSRSSSPMRPPSRPRSSSRSSSRSHHGPKISIVMKALTNIQEKMSNDLGAVKSYLRHGTAMPESLRRGAGSQSQSSHDNQQRRPQQRRQQQRRPQQSQQEEPSEENGWLFGKIEEESAP